MKKLKEIYSIEDIKILTNKKSSLEELNKFDLKHNMFNDKYENIIKKRILKDTNINYEDLKDSNHILERYIVYKILGTITYNEFSKKYFDCDKLDFVHDFYEISKDDKISTDTLLTVQYIYGTISNKILPYSNELYGGDMLRILIFKNQLQNIDNLKNSLGNKLLEAFEKLMIYYHTIGNISPCPLDNYNRNKGRQFFDRLDLYKNTDTFKKNYLNWFEENIKNYKLDKIYNGNNLLPYEFLKNIEVDKIKDSEEIIKYIYSYIDLIIDRTNQL